nr:dihydroorotate dehydrogenase electron transfer subunit [bacterium]
MKETRACVLSAEEISRGIFRLRLRMDEPDMPVGPGQFVQIASPSPKAFLRRPISISDWDENTHVLELIIQQKGEGTRALCAMKPGDETGVLWPLGRGYSLPEGAKSLWLAGGGVGVAPLYLCARQARQRGMQVEAFLGFRSAAYAYDIEKLTALGVSLHLISDDGTLGEKGYVHQAVSRALENSRPDALFTCGPPRMLEALQQTVMAQAPGLYAQASLEERMGCGYGVCRVCACKVEHDGRVQTLRACADGPVFPLQEVKWA